MMREQIRTPLVSIAIPVYNHELYIAKAIDSALMQKTDFEFEIVIGDDFSTDGTREILIKYKEKYPEKIVLILQDLNLGVINNSAEIFHICKGKYIAFLEGDDYWCYENKLQKQIDFLEQNEDYSGCFHDALIVSVPEDNIIKHNQYHQAFKYYSQFNKYKLDLSPPDVIERNIIPTASLIIRNNENISAFFKSFSDIGLSLIWAFQIYMVKDSKFRYFNEVWSVYNDHPSGISKTKSLNSFKLSNIKILKRFANDFYTGHHYSLYKTIASEYLQILYNRQNIKMKRLQFNKYLFLYALYSLKSFRYQIINVFSYRKNLKKQ